MFFGGPDRRQSLGASSLNYAPRCKGWTLFMDEQMTLLGEKRKLAYQVALVRALEYELEGSVAHAGAMLTGFSVKLGEGETLITLRAVLAGRNQIAFVGSGDLPSCLLKVIREAMGDKLRWKDDKYVKRDV